MFWSGALVLISVAEALDDMLELLRHRLTRLLSGVHKPAAFPGDLGQQHPDGGVPGGPWGSPHSLRDFFERELSS